MMIISKFQWFQVLLWFVLGFLPWQVHLPTSLRQYPVVSSSLVLAREDNLYTILGVSKTATTKQIKSAYRKKALETHPDKRKDIPPEQAAEEFHKVVHAFEILSDEQSRRTYDRTGRAQTAGANNRQQNQWSSSFNFRWNSGQRRQYQRPKLKDKFKVKEAMSRVMHIVSLGQLETVMLDDDDRLERNLLMVFVTPQEIETHVDDEICFPYPFAGMSEQGIWWEDKLQTVKVRFNRANDLTRFFNLPNGDDLRASKAPVFLFGRRGETLEEMAVQNEQHRLQTRNRKVFEDWVWKCLEVGIRFINRHPHPVEILWMHGSRGQEKVKLNPGEYADHTTMLTHEWWVRDARVDMRPDSPGRYRLSRSSMVAIWKITSDEPFQELIIHPKSCIDLSGHCPFWKGQRECKKNPNFMREVCPLTCNICSEDADVFKSHDEL